MRWLMLKSDMTSQVSQTNKMSNALSYLALQSTDVAWIAVLEDLHICNSILSPSTTESVNLLNHESSKHHQTKVKFPLHPSKLSMFPNKPLASPK